MRVNAQPINLIGVWRDALGTFIKLAAPLLICVVLGFAAPLIIGQGIATYAVLFDYGWVGPVVTLYEKPTLSTQIALAIVGLMTGSFARGVMTGLALGDATGDMRRTFSDAARMTISHFPSIVCGSMIQSFVIAACVFGMAARLHPLSFDADDKRMTHNWGGPKTAADEVARRVSWHGIETLMQMPSTSLAIFLSGTSTPTTAYEQWMKANTSPTPVTQQRATVATAVQSTETSLLAVASCALLVGLETLLRFRTVTVFKPSRSLSATDSSGGKRSRRFAALGALQDSMRFGVQHFGAITLHVWAMRFTIAVFTAVFVALPIALVDYVAMPHMILLFGKSALLPVLKFAQIGGGMLMSAVVLAFGVVYDAQLYVALSPKT